MYTQEQLEGMSDDQLNRFTHSINNPLADGTLINNYCNNWEDMGPLIAAQKISLAWEWDCKDMYSAFGTQWTERSLGLYPVNYSSSNENQLFAAAIVYILVMQERN